MVLTSHTHRSIEYSARRENGLITLLHDYYLDGMVEGKLPSQYWQKTLPDYPTPLNLSANPKKWWQDHSPLFVQALSVTAPPPPSKRIGVLRIMIQGDVITRVEREILPLQLPLPLPQSSQPYLILACSPP